MLRLASCGDMLDCPWGPTRRRGPTGCFLFWVSMRGLKSSVNNVWNGSVLWVFTGREGCFSSSSPSCPYLCRGQTNSDGSISAGRHVSSRVRVKQKCIAISFPRAHCREIQGFLLTYWSGVSCLCLRYVDDMRKWLTMRAFSRTASASGIAVSSAMAKLRSMQSFEVEDSLCWSLQHAAAWGSSRVVALER